MKNPIKSSLFFVLNLIGFSQAFSQNTDSTVTVFSHRRVQKITYHPEQYRNVPHRDNYISVFALGVDLAREQFVSKPDIEGWGHGYLEPTSGFNIYGIYMPKSFRNIRQNNRSIGSFNWGFGLSVNQFRKSNEETVEINTANRDLAKTRLTSDHFSFYSIARYEWGLGRLYPFVGLSGGFVYASTQLETRNFLQLSGYENSSTNHVHGSSTAFIAPEIGMRLRLNSWVSAVVAYEWRSGSTIKMDDYDATYFNTSQAQFNTTRKNVEYQTEAWKFGFLFDLSGNKHSREVVREAYTDTTYVMEQIQPEKPCPPCPACPTNTTPSNTSPENKDTKKTDLQIRPTQPSNPNPVPTQPAPTLRDTPRDPVEVPKKPLPGIAIPKPTIKKS